MKLTIVSDIHPDPHNPRLADDLRMRLLELSLDRLGFIMPIYTNRSGLILSGHQRHIAAQNLGITHIPVEELSITAKEQKGINLIFNRATNDFSAMDTGAKMAEKIDLQHVMEMADDLPSFEGEHFAMTCEVLSIEGIGRDIAGKYDKKANRMAAQLRRMGIQIPILITESGSIVNGVHRMFDARENGVREWPVVIIPDELGGFARLACNYLSMDYSTHDSEFKRLLRSYAFRRPQNRRGKLAKAFRFWASGCTTLSDSQVYTETFWRRFRDIHGTCLDFGCGLGLASPFLHSKGIDCYDFEPYRINPDTSKSDPDAEYSRRKARTFLEEVANGKIFDSIFLCSVLNSVPFPRDRVCVLAICHALSNFESVIYGTCRDESDFLYEYSGIRVATYHVFDSEPRVRLGDSAARPKIQKFFTQQETKNLLGTFWKKTDTWRGGNIHYFRASAPKRLDLNVLKKALEFEFNLPYADGSNMDLAGVAITAFEHRLGRDLT